MPPLDAADDHYGLRPHCGICGGLMGIGEPFSLLRGNVDSTAFSRRIGTFIFPDYGHLPPNTFGVRLCRKPGCSRCATSAESSTVHSDCLDLVQQKCLLDRYLEQLWIITAWRVPWRHAPHFHLQESNVALDFSELEDLGISRLRCLPREVLHIVYVYSATSLFWRYNSASELARRLPILPSERRSVPLCAVVAWDRGGQLTTSNAINHLPVLRLTIDSWGIKKVERLPEYPAFQGWRTENLLFVVLQERDIEGVIAHLKFGCLRLELPNIIDGLQVWDTPTPPALNRCSFHPAGLSHSTQFRTIQLSQTTGITFFFCFGEIYAIHAHTRRTPSAQSTYQLLSRRRQASVTWVYIPISGEDYIALLGARMMDKSSAGCICLILRMKLAGDVVVGFTYSQEARYLVLSKSPPSTIIYNTSQLRPISVIGAYTTQKDDNLPIDPFRCPLIEKNPPFRDACFSLSPLNGTSRIRLFNDKDNGFCLGILLEFNNGAQRSLGQCRVGIDRSEDYQKPVCICIRRQSYTRPEITGLLQATTVTCTERQEHSHGSREWTCFRLQGELEFWFSLYETRLTVIAD
ncbi:hypothetical protein MGU_09924 [Metarhizium guizhouense ARSEF 977]|uniref:Uncharacterized protein n=1 Tax=Metarhizium guizhouense (strain ARSEF 977) TaxID=1276136 RepID=A0A0B4G7T2_METGA|nr:hypothetical protein MGU_09924 [Metarhizium guizhouense ARSEF 977]